MDNPNTTRSGRGRIVAIALAASFALAASLPATAQDAGESPAAEAAEQSEVELEPTAEEPSAEEATVDEEPAAQGIAFPVMLGGQLLSPQTYSGAAWLELFSGDDPDTVFIDGTNALLESVGASVDDLTIKSAMYEPVENEAAVVLAMRIDGTDARDWVEGAVDVLVADVVEPGLIMRPLSTKWTLRVTDATMPGVYPRTVYLLDDTAWFIQGDNEYVWDTLDQLPDAAPVGASSADALYTDVPLTLGGERRTAFYESTEPLFTPYTLSERLGASIEDWLLDLYVEARLTPAEMLGVIAWWGLAAEDGVRIEGYRLPEGGEELTQRLLDDIFLVRPPEVSVDPESEEYGEIDPIASMLEGVEFREEEIAGQMVTTLDYSGSLQHIYSTADTVWVISDPLGEREKVEEAIEALP